MTLHVDVPGGPELRLEHLVLDANGTLTDRGQLVEGVEERLVRLRHDLALHVLSADTFGTAEAIAHGIGAHFTRVAAGADKLAYVERLGAARCAAIGNGANDAAMLAAAAARRGSMPGPIDRCGRDPGSYPRRQLRGEAPRSARLRRTAGRRW